MRRLILLVALLAVPLAANASAEEERLSLTLEQCLDLALRSSLEIKVGRYGPGIAQTYVKEAESEFDHLLTFRTSGGRRLYPIASLITEQDSGADQTFNAALEVGQKIRTGGLYAFGFTTDDLVSTSNFFSFGTGWTNNFTFRFEQPVLRTAGSTYQDSLTNIARAELRAADQEYRAVLDSTLAGVERDYWNLVYLREEFQVRRHSLRVSEELLRISTKRLEAGAGTRVEVVQADAGVAEREKELILAEHRVADAGDKLRAFLVPFSDAPDRQIRIVPAEDVTARVPDRKENLEARIGMALGARADLLAAKEKLEAIGIRVVRAEDELLPRLDFFGAAALTGLADSFFDSTKELDGRYHRWEIGVSLELPLGNNAAEARHRRALLERSRAIAAFEQLKNKLVLDVRTSVRAVETAAREIVATRRATIAAEAQFEAEKDRLEADKSTNYLLLQVEQVLSDTKSQELLSHVAYRNALVNLEEACGTYLVSRGIAPPPPESGRGEGGVPTTGGRP